jgi:hypothetical protein
VHERGAGLVILSPIFIFLVLCLAVGIYRAIKYGDDE